MLLPMSLKKGAKQRSPVRRRSFPCKLHHITMMACMLGIIACVTIKKTSQENQRMLMSFRNGMLNAIKVKEWRHKVVSGCKAAVSDDDMVKIKKVSREFTSAIHENESVNNLDLKPEYWIQRCPFVFLDIGAGRGDTIGQFIDAGLEGCRRSDDDTEGFDQMHFDAESGKFVEALEKKKNKEGSKDFTMWVKHRIESFYPGLGPEDYCAYGVEANPLLKDDLVKLERHVNRMEPRPLRHLHFLTEKAAHSEDDVKKTIFIDSVRNEDNYPGSSLFESHKNVRESVDKYTDTFKYDVETISLSTLMKQTLSFFKDDANETKSRDTAETTELDEEHKTMEALSKQHLILYFDVEGSEFHVLNEAVDSGVICDFVKDTSNALDIFIHYHSPDVMNVMSKSAKRYIEQVRPYLLSDECGGENLNIKEHMKYFVDVV
mmetsp:Transcript_19350/g.28980  ORF Transcript_19350/g.28980 Transcript_19350/m.28980 type:complete len:432 (-) Transcript_19350:302-1597(-)